MRDTERLTKELADGNVVPFVGSGVSSSVRINGQAAFPSWQDLLHLMADEVSDAADAATVHNHANKKRWFKAAEEALEYLGRADFFKVMRQKFDLPKPDGADWSLPNAIWQLRPELMVTTNYDDVLQWCKPNSRRVLNDQPDELALLYRSTDPDRPTVWHLHGHISKAASVILAPEQYATLYEEATLQQYKAAMIQLQALFVNRTLLFVGFGMQDEYVMQLIADVLAAFGGATSNHFALMRKDDADCLQLWKTHNVRVIEYDDYGPPLIEKLGELSRDAEQLRSGRSSSEEGSGGQVTPRRPVVPPAFTQWLQQKFNDDIELLGMRPKHGQAVKLSHVYVPVVSAVNRAKFRGGGEATLDEMQEERESYQLLQALIDENSLYVSGPPGSGKTTFCRWLMLAVSQGQLPSHPIGPPDGFQESFPQQLRGRLPLMIRLREFWRRLPSIDGDELTWAELESVLQGWIESGKFPGLSWTVVKDHLGAGTCLLIFDGVDEVPLTARKQLLAGLADATVHWTKPGNRILVTSRPYGLTDAQQTRLGLMHAPLAELPQPLQRLLVRRWFHCLQTDGQAESLSGELWTDVEARSEIAKLAGNPLLLTAMCVVYGGDGRLPQDEFDLYDRIVDTVLFSRYDAKSEASTARSRLCVIAHGMHTGEALNEERDQPQAEATVDEIDKMLQHYQDKRPGTELREMASREAREELLSRSGLLLPREDHLRAGFYHFTFQDFLAAERLYDEHSDQLTDVFQQRGSHSEWRKALDLLYGALLHKRSTPDAAIRLLTELVGGLQTPQIRLAVVLADCLQVLHGHGQAIGSDTRQRFVEFCVDAVQRETPVKDRFELALALGKLGDPRVPIDLNDPNAWVEVPAGTYTIGGKFGFDRHTFQVDKPYELSKYPVTNAQFAKFLDADGYHDPSYWQEDGWRWRENSEIVEPDLWRDPKWNGATQPVVGVSWWEADAFCRWGNCRLPSEREWEAAARAPDDRDYPWKGDWQEGICNADFVLEITSPVGIFPRSVATCGAHDMAGNVWEWCDDHYDSGDEKDPDASRVLRGGAWNLIADYCRSTYRNFLQPEDRYDDVGFRAART